MKCVTFSSRIHQTCAPCCGGRGTARKDRGNTYPMAARPSLLQRIHNFPLRGRGGRGTPSLRQGHNAPCPPGAHRSGIHTWSSRTRTWQARTRATARRKRRPEDLDTGRMCVDRRVTVRQRHSKKHEHYEELLARPQVAKLTRRSISSDQLQPHSAPCET